MVLWLILLHVFDLLNRLSLVLVYHAKPEMSHNNNVNILCQLPYYCKCIQHAPLRTKKAMDDAQKVEKITDWLYIKHKESGPVVQKIYWLDKSYPLGRSSLIYTSYPVDRSSAIYTKHLLDKVLKNNWAH